MPCCDPTGAFELVQEPLDSVSLFVEPRAKVDRLFSVRSRRNVRPRALASRCRAEAIGIIGFVSKQHASIGDAPIRSSAAVKSCACPGVIVILTWLVWQQRLYSLSFGVCEIMAGHAFSFWRRLRVLDFGLCLPNV